MCDSESSYARDISMRARGKLKRFCSAFSKQQPSSAPCKILAKDSLERFPLKSYYVIVLCNAMRCIQRTCYQNVTFLRMNPSKHYSILSSSAAILRLGLKGTAWQSLVCDIDAQMRDSLFFLLCLLKTIVLLLAVDTFNMMNLIS